MSPELIETILTQTAVGLAVGLVAYVILVIVILKNFDRITGWVL